jgi:hypothetical protein
MRYTIRYYTQIHREWKKGKERLLKVSPRLMMQDANSTHFNVAYIYGGMEDTSWWCSASQEWIFLWVFVAWLCINAIEIVTRKYFCTFKMWVACITLWKAWNIARIISTQQSMQKERWSANENIFFACFFNLQSELWRLCWKELINDI